MHAHVLPVGPGWAAILYNDAGVCVACEVRMGSLIQLLTMLDEMHGKVVAVQTISVMTAGELRVLFDASPPAPPPFKWPK